VLQCIFATLKASNFWSKCYTLYSQ